MWVRSHLLDGQPIRGHILLKKTLSPITNCQWLLSWGWGTCEPSPIRAGMLTGLILNGSCTLKHSCSEFMGTMAHPVQKTLS